MNNKQTARRGESLIAPGVDRLISKKEAAERLGVSVKTVERLIARGTLHAQKVGGCVRLRLSEVLSVAGIKNEMISQQP